MDEKHNRENKKPYLPYPLFPPSFLSLLFLLYLPSLLFLSCQLFQLFPPWPPLSPKIYFTAFARAYSKTRNAIMPMRTIRSRCLNWPTAVSGERPEKIPYAKRNSTGNASITAIREFFIKVLKGMPAVQPIKNETTPADPYANFER